MDTHVLDSHIQARADAELFSGVVRITHEGEEMFAGAYGLANRAWDVPNTIDTRFDTASVTKLFTSVAALQAVEDGLLDLDTRVVPYLGLEATAIHPEANLGHLLTHTSGIGDDADEEAGEDYADLWLGHASYLVRETVDLLPQFTEKKPNFAPGEGCRYCNAGYVLAGLMVEKATGQRYRDRVRDRVFAPAGMNRSGFFAMDVVEPDVAEGADLVDERWVRNIYSYPPIGSPDGGAHVTAADLDGFLSAVRAGDLLGEEWTDRFLHPYTRHSENEMGPLHFGYGLEFQYDMRERLLYLGKEGINSGTSAVIRDYPDGDTTVVVLSNMRQGVWEPLRFIHTMLTGST